MAAGVKDGIADLVRVPYASRLNCSVERFR